MNDGKEESMRGRLAVWMTASVAVFVLAGSLGVVWAFQRGFEREERRAFEELARVNTAFLVRTRLPLSGQMAGQLGEVIGARVFFVPAHGGQVVGKAGDRLASPEAMALPFDGRVRELPGGEWMAGVEAKDGTRVMFLRSVPLRASALRRGETWAVLGAFWVLSLALGWWWARRVTRPLQVLAASLSRVGAEVELPVLPVARGDEIGQLARALERTHASLREERARRRAAERQALLGRMAGSLAHEVRNPVSAIRLHAQLLEGASPEEASSSGRLIAGEAERIEGLLGQWLSHARPSEPVMADTDVAAELRQAVRVMEPRARHAGVVIEGPGEGVVMVRADRHRLQQVFGNLLLNGVQAMPRGGTLRVSVVDEGGWVAVTVEDEGPGFSAAGLERAGEAFFSEKEGGMGLGLTVAKDICEEHGGHLETGNRPGGGARVVARVRRWKMEDRR